jgi:glycosyltransferase involved in cell wall biosynthesis
MILRLVRMDNFWYIDLMRLLFVADGRSPIAQNWIRYFAERGHETHLASTFACSPDLPLAGLEIIPVAFSGSLKPSGDGRRATRSIGLRSAIRHWLGPFTIHRSAARLRGMIERVQPDLVHALRIPFEGMLAADAYAGTPLLVSVWGNDFTLHAASNWMMAHYTSWTMQVADALHADCQRDIRLGKKWGFRTQRPTLVTPGNGGIRTEIFHPAETAVDEPVVINPRGFRSYVRNDTFFQAIPQVLARQPDARFLCIGMAGEPEALDWVRRLGIEQNVELLPVTPYAQMGNVFRRAQIAVSMGVHDGTPNTLLEAMACGCLPIAGDLESIREWIRNGQNGLLVDSGNPGSLAEAILRGLEDKGLRQQAASLNHPIILERAEYARCMAAAEHFYERVVASPRKSLFLHAG